MFIKVKYGDKEEAIFNPNCRNISLLTFIRDKCLLNRQVELDLSDENGNVKNLRDKPQNMASDVLKEREAFVLLKVNKNPEETEPQQPYTPLLNDNEAISESFLAQLASRSPSRPSSHRVKSSTSQGRRTPVGRVSSNRGPSTDGGRKDSTSNSGANNQSSSSKKLNRSIDGRMSRSRSKVSK